MTTKALQKGLVDAGFDIGVTNTPVTPVYMRGSIPEATNMVIDLRENHGIFCSMVVYPVIPKGMIILRLIPTALHTMADVERTIKSFSSIKSLAHKILASFYLKINKPVVPTCFFNNKIDAEKWLKSFE